MKGKNKSLNLYYEKKNDQLFVLFFLHLSEQSSFVQVDCRFFTSRRLMKNYFKNSSGFMRKKKAP